MYHHIVPLAAGGRDTPNNMVCLCGECHDMIHFDRAGRINHNTLVKAGIHAAQARGVHFGRKPLDYEKYMRVIAERSSQFNPDSVETEMEIAESLGIKTTTYYKIKRMLLAAIQSDSWPYEWPKPCIVRNRPEYEHVIRRSRGEMSAAAPQFHPAADKSKDAGVPGPDRVRVIQPVQRVKVPWLGYASADAPTKPAFSLELSAAALFGATAKGETP